MELDNDLAEFLVGDCREGLDVYYVFISFFEQIFHHYYSRPLDSVQLWEEGGLCCECGLRVARVARIARIARVWGCGIEMRGWYCWKEGKRGLNCLRLEKK